MSKQYEQLVNYLMDKSEKYELSPKEKIILILVEKYLEIKNNKIILETNIYNPVSFEEAIIGNDFYQALKLNREYNENKNISNENSEINLLLKEIWELNYKLKIQKIIPRNKDFTIIIDKLQKKDFNKALFFLRKYLKKNNLKKFEELIVCLIKISYLEEDQDFVKPFMTLDMLTNNKFIFDLSDYISDFRSCISENKFVMAEIYLNIIKLLNSFENEPLLVNGLSEVLELSKEKFEILKNNGLISNELFVSEEKSRVINEDINSMFDKAYENVEEIELKEHQQKIEKEKDFITNTYNELIINKGILLFDSMNKYRTKLIKSEFDLYNDVYAFIVKDGNLERLALEYKGNIEDQDISEVTKTARQTFIDKKYEECIDLYLKVLQTDNINHPLSYAQIGLSYYKLENFSKALDYLIVANYLAKEQQINLDFESVIQKIRNKINLTESEPKLIKNAKKKINNTSKIYVSKKYDSDYKLITDEFDMINFNIINRFILESGLDLESACQEMNMNPEQIDVVSLLYAREFYTNGLYDKGNVFIKYYEKSTNKTEKTKILYQEIQKDKKLFVNNQINLDRPLAYSLIPFKRK